MTDDQMSFDFDSDDENITIEEFEAICEEYAQIRENRDALKSKLEAVEGTLRETKEKIKQMLSAVDKDGYSSKHGKVYTITKQRVSLPQGEDKKLFFDYLKNQQLFDEVATVNSMWLNGYYRKEVESAKERGEMVHIPGIGQPYLDIDIGFSKARKK